MRLSELTPDGDPLPRAAAVGPGSRFVGMTAAVDVEPSVIEMGARPDVAARAEQQLRSWRFTAAEVGAAIRSEPPAGLAAGRAVAIPHSWARSEPELADHKGPCWYARSVVLEPDRHHQLRLNGVDYVRPAEVAWPYRGC